MIIIAEKVNLQYIRATMIYKYLACIKLYFTILQLLYLIADARSENIFHKNIFINILISY